MKRGRGGLLSWWKPLGALIGFNRPSSSFFKNAHPFFFLHLIFPSVSTVSPTSADQRPAPKSEYETNSSTVTSATCNLKVSYWSVWRAWCRVIFGFFFFFMKNPALSPLFQLANQPPCDVTVLQQIEEETCGDGNPWTLTRGKLQIAGTLGLDILSFMTLENCLIRYMFVGRGGGSSTCDWEGTLGKQCCAFMCLWYA